MKNRVTQKPYPRSFPVKDFPAPSWFHFILGLVLCAPGLAGAKPEPAVPDPTAIQLNAAYDPVVKVFYGTDRVKTGVGYGSKRDLKCPHYGEALVTLKVNYRRAKNPFSEWLQYTPALNLHQPTLTANEMTEDAFNSRLGGDLSNSGKHYNRKNESTGTIVFIHGYNCTFKSAAVATAQMAYDLQLPGEPLCYSWPSDGEVWISDYENDQKKVEKAATINDLVDFLTKVAARRQTRDGQITLVAHSMGTYLLSEALARMASDKKRVKLFARKIKHVVFISADICTDEFTGPDGFFSKFGPFQKKLVLYVSSNDSVLRASDFVNRSDCRARRVGQGGEALRGLKGAVTLDATGIAVDWGLGHALYEHDGVIDDLYLFLNQGLGPSRRLLTDRGGPRGENHFYDLFDGVHTIEKITDFSGVAAFGISSQFGYASDSFSNGFRASWLVSWPYYQCFQISTGFFDNIFPTQLDVRWNPWVDNFRPFLNTGLDFYSAGSSSSNATVLGYHWGGGVEYAFDSGWALAIGLDHYDKIRTAGSLAAQPTLDHLFNDRDFPFGQAYFQFSKYFDLKI